MWQTKKIIKRLYDTELIKQTDAYQYYIDNVEKKFYSDVDLNEGEHESAPLIDLKGEDISLVSEDENYKVFECGDYYVYESKKGYSSVDEKLELATYANKLNADLIYSDIDGITCDGKRIQPFYKSQLDIDTNKYFTYYSDLYAIKKNKSRMDIGLLEKISHVPKVLFHYEIEKNPDYPQGLYDIKNTCYLTDDFYIDSGEFEGDKDKISVIIPSKDNPTLVDKCLKGIVNAKVKSKINEIEVVVVDNGSTQGNKDTITGVIGEYTANDPGIKIEYLYEKEDFNFSHMCNTGAKGTNGEYLLFLNDDIEVTDELFLLKLLYFARMDHVGAVGCKLLYPGADKKIQHIGISCLRLAGPTHKLSTFSDDDELYFGCNRGVHNVLAVTGACLMVSREKYFKIGGFHDKMKVGYNDVDLCVSLYENGYLNIVNNECCLVHHESISRGSDAASERKLKRLDAERALLYERHPWLLSEGDPYYNKNLAEDFLDYRVNVIPDFERRDYISAEHNEFNSYVSKIEKNAKDVVSTKNMFMNIEKVVKNRDYIEISGWALINKKDNYVFDTYVAVKSIDGGFKVFETAPVYRVDLATVFPDARYSEISGMFARIELSSITGSDSIEDITQLGVLIVNKQSGKKYYAGFRKSDI